MPEPLDAAALQEASAVLRRLAELIENGTLAASGETQFVTAAAWQGAAEALSAAADGAGDAG